MDENANNNTDELKTVKDNKNNLEDKSQVNNKNETKKTNMFLAICVTVVLLGILLEVMKAQQRYQDSGAEKLSRTPKYWVYSAYSDVQNKNGLLKHVHLVLERVGFELNNNKSDWNLLWSHDYPFRVLYPNLHKLKPHQKVNHYPGTGFITNKVDLATSNSKYIPKAFKLPQNKDEFLKYASNSKNSMFLEKNNQHRGVYLKNVSEIDWTSGDSFVQEYVQKPFLVDGHKFDIGVYVVLTSVNPLRVYWYKGDVLFRYCPAKYYPFDPKNLDKYVVGDDYLPTWDVPSLSHSYKTLGLSMKDTFDLYVRSQGRDPWKMWEEVEKAIAEVFVAKEKYIIEALKSYPSQDNFFELMRFDLVVDENSKVYLLEANMSPNLSSAHYPPNQLLYEQVLYNLFTITGVANIKSGYVVNKREQQATENMVSSQKNIASYGEECSTLCKNECKAAPTCGLCTHCVDAILRRSLLRAHTEYIHRGDFRRLFPPPMTRDSLNEVELENLTEINKLQYLWYQGKCNIDVTWCN